MTRDDITPRQVHPSRWPWLLDEPRRNRHPARTAAIAVVLVGYAWVAASAAPFSTRALVGMLIPGAVLGVIAYGRPPERIPAPAQLDPLGMSYWMIVVAALFEWEASAWRDNSWPWHPSLTNLVDPLLSPHPMKAAAIVLWLLAGWGLVKR